MTTLERIWKEDMSLSLWDRIWQGVPEEEGSEEEEEE